eukprot:1145539-Amorphochlora_amoeboformis.AAC.1
MRNIRRHARGPHLRDLFRALRERPIKLRNMRRGKDRWKWEAVFKEHITDQMCVSERQNGSLCTRLSKKLKSEYHNFMSKRLTKVYHCCSAVAPPPAVPAPWPAPEGRIPGRLDDDGLRVGNACAGVVATPRRSAARAARGRAPGAATSMPSRCVHSRNSADRASGRAAAVRSPTAGGGPGLGCR